MYLLFIPKLDKDDTKYPKEFNELIDEVIHAFRENALIPSEKRHEYQFWLTREMIKMKVINKLIGGTYKPPLDSQERAAVEEKTNAQLKVAQKH